jgi:hypothetical protein
MMRRLMELWAWPVFKPHHSDLIASPLMAGILEGIKGELGYESFFRKSEDE